MAAALLLQQLVADPGRALAVSRMAEVMAKCEGVARMLALRMQQEATYLHKLELQKVGGVQSCPLLRDAGGVRGCEIAVAG